MIFSFVILHYNVIAETITCVNSIKERTQHRVNIIIVDNASPNGTGNKLQQIYKDDNEVTVILNNQNLGFAKGNNVGIHYAKDTLNSDFVIVLNNDTYLVQNNFIDVIVNEWNYSHFAVMGPKIHTLKNINQNPVPGMLSTTALINKEIRKCIYKLIRVYLGIDNLFEFFKKYIKDLYKSKKVNQKKSFTQDERLENIKLHGCCYVFSPVFFEHFHGFDSRTFMYAEEDILYAHVTKKKLLTVYNPDLEIFHAEMSATKSSSKNLKKMKIFRCKECIKSLNILKKIINT